VPGIAETNQELIKHLLNNAPTGALSEIFIISAIEAYSISVLEAGIPDEENTIISMEAWNHTAAWMLQQFKAQWGEPVPATAAMEKPVEVETDVDK